MHTLVLSSGYQPIRVVSWKKALKDLAKGRVELLEGYAGTMVRFASQIIQIPAVVRFLRQAAGYFRRGVKFNRRNIWVRDKGKCQYCGKKVALDNFTFDHVLPQAQGGKATWDNIVVACPPCNQRKANRTPAQAGMTLLQKPVMPKTVPCKDLSLVWGESVPTCWQDYLGSVAYWHGALT